MKIRIRNMCKSERKIRIAVVESHLSLNPAPSLPPLPNLDLHPNFNPAFAPA